MDHPDFHTIVAEIWSQDVRGSPSSKVAEKLRRLKVKLKGWNWNSFGDLNVRIDQLQTIVAELESQIQQTWSSEVEDALVQSNLELRQAMNWDAELRFQKTRTRWLQDGDRNTKFFHAVIRDVV